MSATDLAHDDDDDDGVVMVAASAVVVVAFFFFFFFFNFCVNVLVVFVIAGASKVGELSIVSP